MARERTWRASRYGARVCVPTRESAARARQAHLVHVVPCILHGPLRAVPNEEIEQRECLHSIVRSM